MNTHPHILASPKRGAALLIVIGLVSLLLISTMAFSVLMTIERHAAGNYSHAVQTRQVLYAGLSQAIADISASPNLSYTGVGNQSYPLWTNLAITAKGGRIISLTNEVRQSYDTNNATPCFAKIYSPEACSNLPQSLLQYVLAVQPEYLAFQANGNTLGRYAYIAVNVSGLLDANVICTTNHRGVGTSPGEIQIDDSASPATPFELLPPAGTFASQRTTDQRYESLAELAALNTGVNPSKLSNFETFSYSPLPELQPDGVTPKVFIGYDPALFALNPLKTPAQQLRDKSNDIVTAFSKCFDSVKPMPEQSLTVYQAAQRAYNSLIDYVDPGAVPEGGDMITQFARPSSKNAPMLSYISLQMQYTISTQGMESATPPYTNYIHTVKYTPFVGFVSPVSLPLSASSYTATLSAWLKTTNSLFNTGFESLYPFPLAGGVAPTYTKPSTFNFSRGNACAAVFSTIVTSYTNRNAAVVPQNDCYLRFAVQVQDAGNHVVDQVPTFASPTFPEYNRCSAIYYQKVFGSYFKPPYSGINPESHALWVEVLDPAIHWDGRTELSGSGHWIGSESCAKTNIVSTSLSALTNSFPAFFSAGNLTATPAYQTWLTKVQNNQGGGLLASYLLTNDIALAWWNANSTNAVMANDSGRFAPLLVPDGGTIGSAGTYDSYNTQARYRLYCKGGAITNVGELGFLPIGRWMTFNLYPHNHANTYRLLPDYQFHRVLDYFTVRNPTNTAARGLVSLASRNPQVHGSVFLNAPIDEFNLHAGGTISSGAAFGWVARSMTDNALDVTNLADIGFAFWGAQTNLAASFCANEFERKALVRNVAGLYTTRQQLYTIIVRADAVKSGFGTGVGQNSSANPLNTVSVQGSAIGIFQVWRDPVQVGGQHPCFVRLSKIIYL